MRRPRRDKDCANVLPLADDRQLERPLGILLVMHQGCELPGVQGDQFRYAHAGREQRLHDRPVAQALRLGRIRQLEHRLNLVPLQKGDRLLGLLLRQFYLRRGQGLDVPFSQVAQQGPKRDQIEVLRLLGEVPAGRGLVAAGEIEPVIPDMLGRQLAGLQIRPVGFLKPEEEDAKILAVIALRIVRV